MKWLWRSIWVYLYPVDSRLAPDIAAPPHPIIIVHHNFPCSMFYLIVVQSTWRIPKLNLFYHLITYTALICALVMLLKSLVGLKWLLAPRRRIHQPNIIQIHTIWAGWLAGWLAGMREKACVPPLWLSTRISKVMWWYISNWVGTPTNNQLDVRHFPNCCHYHFRSMRYEDKLLVLYPANIAAKATTSNNTIFKSTETFIPRVSTLEQVTCICIYAVSHSQSLFLQNR